MSRSFATTSRCTKVVLSGSLAGGSLALRAGTAQAGDGNPMAPVTFSDSTAPSYYTVPAGACSITVNAVGGQGGDAQGVGGAGGQVVSALAVAPAEQFEVFVGGQGSLAAAPTVVRGAAGSRTNAASGRSNILRQWLRGRETIHPATPPPAGGGLSGGEPTGGSGGVGYYASAGGGGASFVFVGQVTGQSPLIVAAGGGGAAGSDLGRVTGGNGGAGDTTGAAGAAGTGSIDSNGQPRTPAASAWDGRGGGGGGTTAGGAGGAAGTSGTRPGAAGDSPDGGGGGYYDVSGSGGGGGAGIYGGGGGGAAWRQDANLSEAAGGGGGGGSNLAPAGSTVNGVSSQTGDGFVTVTPHATCPPSAVQRISATAGNGSARVTWTAPADVGGAPVTGYTITAYIKAVAKKTVTSPGTGLTATVPGLINGTHYTFTVAAVNSAGTGADSVHSNVVQPVAPPRPPAPPVAPFVLRSQTLWGHVEIAAHSTRFAFEVTFNQTRPSLRVTLTSKATGTLLAATTIHPARASRRFTGVLAFPTSAIKTWGAYTYTLTTGAPASTFVFRSDVRKHSTLALAATRARGVVTITGSAKVLDTTTNAYVGWANRRVEIQQETSTGWVTVATTVTNARGHVARALHLPAGTTLRLVDADTATQFGRASNVRQV